MNETRYEALIAALCEQEGLADWRQVARSGHIEMQGHTVGLIAGEDGRDEWLSIYIDLGPTFDARDADVFRRMLVANVEQRGTISGAFALHPQTAQAVYHMVLDMGVGPRELAERLEAAMAEIPARFNAIVA